ncbi:hypothetical protein N2152v2_001783 [Parachlorella kessleri]
MKFGKLLQEFQHGGEIPDCILDYKSLKKKLKAIKAQKESGAESPTAAATVPETSADTPRAALTADELEFVRLLNEDVSRINEFFIEREEEAVIRLKALEDRVADAAGPQELSALGIALVDFHGEMVLLLHWSLINYAAVAKILKKHDKLTGSLLRAPYLSNMLQQPFLSTESISMLVRRTEQHVQRLAAGAEGGEGAGRSQAQQKQQARGAAECTAASSKLAPPHIVKRTRAALGMLHELQEKASTPSTLLPPSTASLQGPSPKRQKVEQEVKVAVATTL